MKIFLIVLLVVVAISIILAAAAIVYCAIDIYRTNKDYPCSCHPEVARNGEGRRIKERV